MTMHDDAKTAADLEATGDFRVLRRLRLEPGNLDFEQQVSARFPALSAGDAADRVAPVGDTNAVVLEFAPSGNRRHRSDAVHHLVTAPTGARAAGSEATSIDAPASILLGAAIDLETTGIDPERHRIIEIAVRLFGFDASGRITRIDPLHAWLEDPGEPLDPTIVRLTGLNDADLAGQAIDEAALYALLGSVDVLVFHHAGFDRKFVDRRFAGLRGRAWACTLREIDWGARGMNGGSLPWLLTQLGFFHDAHRAGADVDAVIALLRHRAESGRTALYELLDRAARSTFLISAVGAPYGVKDELKQRGYRWNAGETTWQREVAFAEREAEEAWLSRHVYDPSLWPKASGPRVDERDWTTRHA